jgi:hypothetical protein
MRPLLILLLLSAACATAAPAPTVRTPDSTAVAAAAARWADRLDPAEARAALDAWQRAADADPGDPALHLAISRACHFLAEAHQAPDRLALLERGVAAAERGLRAASPEFDRLRRLDAPFEEAIATLDAGAAPLLYWWATQRMAVAREAGFAATVEAHPVVWRAMERVEALAPDTWYRGADRYFAAAYAVMPPVAGGDLEQARARFEAALAAAPRFLETRLLYAVLYATAAGDDALYRAQLTAIVEAPPDDPEIEPEQELVRRRARALLGE